MQQSMLIGLRWGRKPIFILLFFNAKFEPIIQNGHVHMQESVPVTFVQNNMSKEEETETGTWELKLAWKTMELEGLKS